jgi:hypothetical protein
MQKTIYKGKERENEDERSEEKARLFRTLKELKRQNQHYSDERDRLSRVLETLTTQDRDLRGKIEEVKHYLENVQEFKEWTSTSDAVTQATKSVPDSTTTNGQKRQRETLDKNGDEQTEADEPRPCKKLKTPELTVPATAESSAPSPTFSVDHQDFNPVLERDSPTCSRCSTSPDRRTSAIKDTSKEALSQSTYVSPYLSPPREMESAPKRGDRAILQFNPDAVASILKRQVKDTKMSLGGIMNHQSSIGPAIL